MPRTTLALLAIAVLAPAALAPLALAEPLASVGVGPGPSVFTGEDGRPYYVLVHLSEPDPPREPQAGDDCTATSEGADGRAPRLEHALLQLVLNVSRWHPQEEPRVSGWYPRCFGGTLLDEHSPVWGRVSYDFPTGRYHLEADAALVTTGPPTDAILVPIWPDAGSAQLPLGLHARLALAASGTTGIGTEADCETCPPPCC